LEVGLDLELRPERLVRGHGRRDALAAETLAPFLSGAIGDEAELAGQAEAGLGRMLRRVVAPAPPGVAADALALQRADRRRERRRAGRGRDRDQVAHVTRELD